MILCGLFAALTGIGAFIKIPFFPVPFTLQTFFVVLSASILPVRWAVSSQLLYIVIGLIGFPVFSQGGGPAYIFVPTFGYLVAFPLAALFIAKLQPKNEHVILSFLVNFFALFFILLFGSIWLYFHFRDIWTIQKVLFSGLILFLPGAVIKAIVATAIGTKMKKNVIIHSML